MTVGVPGIVDLPRDAPCEFCGTTEGRQLSHIIPKFVFQHASVRSPTGFLRTNFSPNRRAQDGPKEYLLCLECERRFAAWERKFAPLFKSHHEQPGKTFDYGPEEALCALSIAWRVLAHARAHTEINHLTFGSDYSRTDAAFSVWKQVMLGERSNPGAFRVYWMWFDHVVDGPPDINRYLFHAVDFDVLASESSSFSIAHLPGLFIVGSIEKYPRSEFQGFDVSFNGGRYYSLGRKVAPIWLQKYIEGKMRIRREALDSISPTQQAKIDATVLKDPQRAVESPLFRSVFYDTGGQGRD